MNRILVGAMVVVIAVFVVAAFAEAPERYRGRIVDTGSGMTKGGTWWMTFHIDATTPNEEVAVLAQTLAADGQKAFMEATRKLEPAGWIRIGSGTRWHVSVIRSGETPDGGRVIRGFTDRPIQMTEIFGSYRTREYTLGMVELHLDAEGKGSGIILPMSQISFNDAGDIEIESFGNQPFRVMNVAPEKLKEKK